jgi:hypothetical protein
MYRLASGQMPKRLRLGGDIVKHRQMIALAVVAWSSLFAGATLMAQNAAIPPGPPTKTEPLPAPPMPMGYGPNGKPLYFFMVFSDPTAGQEEEFNAWYDRIHAPVVIEGGDFVWAQRFVMAPPDVTFGGGNPTKSRYLVIFAAETDNIKKTLDDAKRRLALPRNTRSSALDYSTLSGLNFQAVGPLITQKYAKELLAAEEKAGRLPAMDAPIPPGYRGVGAGRNDGGPPGSSPGAGAAPGPAPSGPP